ncbi:MAG: tetratricopeptide repeat protein [Bacteroidales bacterium]|nr:tetratricopeptide repeat protein [Bacteroidales bacterium]
MKKIFATIAAIVLAAGAAFAQDMAELTEVYNSAAALLQEENKAGALENFNKAVIMAEAIGDEAADILSECKGIIPKLSLSMAKDLVKAGDFDAAVLNLDYVAKVAEKYDDFDTMGEATGLIPQVLKQKGATQIKDKDYAGAVDTYNKILADDPADGVSALRLGSALSALGKTEEAISAFETAAANGQDAQANKQIGTIFLKKASANLKEKKYTDAVENALKSNEYAANPQALQIAGQASQLAGKNADAIKYLSQYLEAAPTAKNAGQIAYTVGALYQNAKNNAKAKEFYSKALSDPKYGPEAKKLIDTLK